MSDLSQTAASNDYLTHIIHKDFLIISTSTHESFSHEKYIYKYNQLHLEWLYKSLFTKTILNWVITGLFTWVYLG